MSWQPLLEVESPFSELPLSSMVFDNEDLVHQKFPIPSLSPNLFHKLRAISFK